MIDMLRALIGLSGMAAVVLAPAPGFAQYRDPDEAVAGAVVGGVLGGVIEGWQRRQARHEERMERERWRQAHGDRPYPGDFDPEGVRGPRVPPRAEGPRPGDFRGRGPGPDGVRGAPAWGEGAAPFDGRGPGGWGPGSGPDGPWEHPPRGYPPRERPARFDDGRGPWGSGRFEGPDGPRRPGFDARRPAWQDGYGYGDEAVR